MKRSLKKLMGFSIQDIEKNQGKVNDFLFDEEKWIIRYIEIDFGKEFHDKRLLISYQLLEAPNWGKRIFPIKKTKTEIINSPELKDALPVSRKYEEALNKHYQLNNYWEVIPLPTHIYPHFSPQPISVHSKYINEKEIGTHLRSYNEVNGYHIHAEDGKIGHVIDFIIDDDNWQVIYAVIDTSNWRPWSKKTMIPVSLLNEISYTDNEIRIGLITETIRKSPEFKEDMLTDTAFEEKLHHFYNKEMVGEM